MDDGLPDMLEQCLARLEHGATVDECLAAYPQQQAELELPLRMVVQLRGLPRPTMPAATRASLETQMLAQAAARRPSTLSTSPASAPPGSAAWHTLAPDAILAGILRALGYSGPLGQPWLRLAAAAVAIVLALALGAGALAAARALVDAVRPQVTTTPIAAPSATPSATPSAIPSPTPSPLAPLTLDGQIERIAQEGWVVGGTTVVLSSTTTIDGVPMIGATAHIDGALLATGAVQAQSIVVEALPPTPTSTPTPAPTQTILPTQVILPTQPPPPTQPHAPADIPAPAPAPTAVPPQPAQSDGGEQDGQKSCRGQQRGRDEKKCDPKPHDNKKPKKPGKK